MSRLIARATEIRASVMRVFNDAMKSRYSRVLMIFFSILPNITFLRSSSPLSDGSREQMFALVARRCYSDSSSEAATGLERLSSESSFPEISKNPLS
jgi:hypothetical protein